MKLRKAVFEDWKFLLEWRNDKETRKNSNNVKLVEEEKHKRWLRETLSNKNKQLYVAIFNGISVGTVRADLDQEMNVYELSWTVSPVYRVKGNGKKMVKLLVEKLNSKVRAEIKKDNAASIKIAEYSGMKYKLEESGILHYSNY